MDKSFTKVVELISRFKTQEYPKVLMNVFGELSWDNIRSKAHVYKINLMDTRQTAVLCARLFEGMGPTATQVQDAILGLTFFDFVFHHDTKMWSCILPGNKVDEFPEDVEQLEERIVQQYRMEARDVRLFILHSENLLWVMSIEKKVTKRGMKYGKPFYFVINLDIEQKYVLYRPEVSAGGSLHPIELFVRGLGFDEFRNINLSSRDVLGIFAMLQRPEQLPREMPSFEPSNRVVRQGNVVDFTLGRAREQFAQEVLRGLSPGLNKLEVHAQNMWRGKYPIARERISTQLTMRTRGSTGVPAFLEELLKEGCLTLPLPSYIQGLSSLRTNVIRLKDKDETADEGGEENYFEDSGEEEEEEEEE